MPAKTTPEDRAMPAIWGSLPPGGPNDDQGLRRRLGMTPSPASFRTPVRQSQWRRSAQNGDIRQKKIDGALTAGTLRLTDSPHWVNCLASWR